jgi:putative ABC transport system substrate-binding protein
MYPVGDPVSAGFIASLGRPGGNITGVALNNLDVAAKRLEILKEAVPNTTRVGLLVNEANPLFTDPQVKATRKAAEGLDRLGIKIDVIGVRDPGDLDKVFTKSGRLQALVILPDPLFFTIPTVERLARLALRSPLGQENDQC